MHRRIFTQPAKGFLPAMLGKKLGAADVEVHVIWPVFVRCRSRMTRYNGKAKQVPRKERARNIQPFFAHNPIVVASPSTQII